MKVSNIPFNEIFVGRKAAYSRAVTDAMVKEFAALSGDLNPVHLDEKIALNSVFGGRVAHGMLTGAIVSAALAMCLPGPGTIYLGQTLKFHAPVRIGDFLTVNLEVKGLRESKRIVILDCHVVNQNSCVVADGEATVLAPGEKLFLEIP